VHPVDLLALLGFEDVAWLCSRLFEEMEGPVSCAVCFDLRCVKACLEWVGLEVQSGVAGRSHDWGCIGCHNDVANGRIHRHLLKGCCVLSDRTEEVRVLNEPLELRLASKFMVYTNVDKLGICIVFEFHAAFEIDLRKNFWLFFFSIAVIL